MFSQSNSKLGLLFLERGHVLMDRLYYQIGYSRFSFNSRGKLLKCPSPRTLPLPNPQKCNCMLYKNNSMVNLSPLSWLHVSNHVLKSSLFPLLGWVPKGVWGFDEKQEHGVKPRNNSATFPNFSRILLLSPINRRINHYYLMYYVYKVIDLEFSTI